MSGASTEKSGRTGVQPVRGVLKITRRNLPHWQIDGRAYFVTFRLRKGQLTAEERDIVLGACLHWHEKKWHLYAATVMPDHAHLLVQPLQKRPEQWFPIGEILQSVKRHSALQINTRRGRTGPLWLEESFDRIVRNEAEFREKLTYIAGNAVKNGLAHDPLEYPHFWWDQMDVHRIESCAT
jgi:REP element-mobilizing transposase RayT